MTTTDQIANVALVPKLLKNIYALRIQLHDRRSSARTYRSHRLADWACQNALRVLSHVEREDNIDSYE